MRSFLRIATFRLNCHRVTHHLIRFDDSDTQASSFSSILLIEPTIHVYCLSSSTYRLSPPSLTSQFCKLPDSLFFHLRSRPSCKGYVSSVFWRPLFRVLFSPVWIPPYPIHHAHPLFHRIEHPSWTVAPKFHIFLINYRRSPF